MKIHSINVTLTVDDLFLGLKDLIKNVAEAKKLKYWSITELGSWYSPNSLRLATRGGNLDRSRGDLTDTFCLSIDENDRPTISFKIYDYSDDIKKALLKDIHQPETPLWAIEE